MTDRQTDRQGGCFWQKKVGLDPLAINNSVSLIIPRHPLSVLTHSLWFSCTPQLREVITLCVWVCVCELTVSVCLCECVCVCGCV